MAILGLESLVFGVDDMDICSNYWNDYGLSPLSRTPDMAVWEVDSGSRTIIRPLDHADLPPALTSGSTLRETILGVDTQDNVDRLAARLGDSVVSRDADGTVHFVAPDGNFFGLRTWQKKSVTCAPDPVNAPGRIVRLNQHRKWRIRARPKTINHVVLLSQDYVASYEFFRDRLDFKMTDHAKGSGIFARADGTFEHHTLFWVSTGHPLLLGKRGFHHCAFGVEDVDEIMVGANYMQDRGWSDQRRFAERLNRHRISSALYYYFPNPNGGEAEYHADTDYLDSAWIPRAWEAQFGASMWGMKSPGFFRDGGAISWDMTLDPYESSIEEFRSHGIKEEAAAAANLRGEADMFADPAPASS